MKVALGSCTITKINQHSNLVAFEFGAPGGTGTDGNLGGDRNRDREIVLSLRDNAATLVTGPVLENHSERQSPDERSSWLAEGGEHQVGGLERHGAADLGGFLAENGSIRSGGSFALEFEGLFIKRARENHPLVQVADLGIGQIRTQVFIANALCPDLTD